MNFKYLDTENQEGLIDGVILRKLIIHKDESGSLVETMRRDWQDVLDEKEMPFAMQYMSITPPGLARDENQWHVHKHQFDRFICASGKIVTAIYDSRENSKTKDKLNLFIMSPQKDEEMFMVVIPKETYHGFMVVSKENGYLLNFPTKLYNPEDEGRIPNNQFDWNKVREDFGL
ncbi:MAG: dTDP-4-dehydrorhamnose 3,5-epimerase family protein [Candidatus Curtissbacteria bacterium]|nr:dTDP-4-dehydrorhamnose 3,5-epimerase family protein [Candidatus Curtissbacteria bacterium]